MEKYADTPIGGVPRSALTSGSFESSALSTRVSLGGALTTRQAEEFLIKNNTRNYPADAGDLRAQHGEESYEMRANGMRAPSYGKWLEQQVGRRVRSQARDTAEAKLKSTTQGRTIEAGFQLAKELYREQEGRVGSARNSLSERVRATTGKSLDAYIREQRFAGRKPDAVDAEIKRAYPAEHAELERVSRVAQGRFEDYQKREKVRAEFLAS
jgi:hypothetical protein